MLYRRGRRSGFTGHWMVSRPRIMAAYAESQGSGTVKRNVLPSPG
ncbi:hypothetical protein CCC_04110 [Paramagnetospirillum magnetotacticum MS-1]|uniref:Uncharacterized protein n=1 Tax=Paramagnetospirillum magnetotacticum MS-1 TaxID=272627 RepID=A0A0C2YIQ2_PARME|nr:hypothetical protein CCC_04110 [Paramagnetospirillum magnetotacticum MS-1]